MPEPDWIKDGPLGALVQIRVTPNGRKNEIQGVVGPLLKIRLTAPPVDGKANQVLREFLAGTWDSPVSAVTLLRGEKNRLKTVLVRGRSADELRKRIGQCS